MYVRQNDPDLLDVGSHIVEMNKLMTQLNKLTRETYKPAWSDIDAAASELRHHCSMIQRIVDRVYE
jgi:hypothetical protein